MSIWACVMANLAPDNLVLQSLDSIKIYSIWDISDHRKVSISGHVRNPGTYPYADSLTLFDLIFRAGGLQDSIFRSETYLTRADLIRLNPDGITRRTIPSASKPFSTPSRGRTCC